MAKLMRPATPDEIEMLNRHFMERWNDDNPDTLAQAFVGVCDDYISDGPGYVGKVFAIVWSGGPEIVTTVVEIDGKWMETNSSEYLGTDEADDEE